MLENLKLLDFAEILKCLVTYSTHYSPGILQDGRLATSARVTVPARGARKKRDRARLPRSPLLSHFFSPSSRPPSSSLIRTASRWLFPLLLTPAAAIAARRAAAALLHIFSHIGSTVPPPLRSRPAPAPAHPASAAPSPSSPSPLCGGKGRPARARP